LNIDYTITPARFALKKLGRRTVISAGRILYAISSERPRVRVLTYHRFGNVSWDPCCIEGSTFQSNLSRLSKTEKVITPGEFAVLMSAPEDLQHRRILLTIDDGHISVQWHALPRLDDLGIKAILFVCPGLVESQSSSKTASERQFMGWDDLALARANGHEIAPHSLYHDSLARMPLAAALDDIDRSTELLERRLGVRTRFFFFLLVRAAISPKRSCANSISVAIRSASAQFTAPASQLPVPFAIRG
jgi:hypothetical protein